MRDARAHLVPGNAVSSGSRLLRLDFPLLAGRHPVYLPADTDLVAGLAQILRAWSPVITATTQMPAAGEAFSRLQAEEDGYTLTSSFLDVPLAGLPAASALCGIVADLSQACFDSLPGWLALHCGAVRFERGLVAFAGSARAGKSTLMARLTAERDVQVFCDDVLPLDPEGNAVALGIAPRLRIPLPEGASARFRRHVEASAGPRDDRYAYVIADTVAPHGTLAPLQALVLLDRREQGPARLHQLAPGETEQLLLRHNMASFPDPADAAAAVVAAARGLEAVRLVYSELEDAVRLIRSFFDRGVSARAVPEPPLAVATPAPELPGVKDDIRYRHADGTAIRTLPAGAFIWRLGDASLWQLNPVAHAAWIAMEIPGSAGEIAEALSGIWQDVPPDRLLADLGVLMAQLAAAGLIEEDEAA